MGIIEIFNKNIAKIAPITFIILTLIISLLKVPFFDETHALIISQFNFSEIFQLTRIEGHPLLWYLILKPFNRLDWYPYSLDFINWIFSSLMIIVLWKYAPFNNFIKFLITFSFPFFQYFGVVSRPYTLGVLIIFLLCALYKNATKKPILYSFLLVLCANISIITLFVAFSFGVLFLYDLFKEKNIKKFDLCWIISLLVIEIILFCVQFLFYELPITQPTDKHIVFLKHFSYFVFNPFKDLSEKNINQILLHLFSFISFYYFAYLFIKKAKKSLVLFAITSTLMVITFLTFYIGAFWHYIFFLIVFICALWINWEKIKKEKIANILFILLLLLNTTSYSVSPKGKNEITFNTQTYKKILKIITTNKYKNAKLFCFDSYERTSPGLLLYLKKQNIILYDNNNNPKDSFVSIRNLQNASYKTIDIEKFVSYLDKNKENYIISATTNTNLQTNFYIQEKNTKLFLDLVETHPDLNLSIYKLQYKNF